MNALSYNLRFETPSMAHRDDVRGKRRPPQLCRFCTVLASWGMVRRVLYRAIAAGLSSFHGRPLRRIGPISIGSQSMMEMWQRCLSSNPSAVTDVMGSGICLAMAG
jgi:hypothetical protein